PDIPSSPTRRSSDLPSITFAMENAVAKATDAADRKKKEEALANHLALPHPAGPEARRMWAIAMSFSIFKNSKDPEAAMSLVAHLLSPEETLGVMKDSYGQFAPVLDKGGWPRRTTSARTTTTARSAARWSGSGP